MSEMTMGLILGCLFGPILVFALYKIFEACIELIVIKQTHRLRMDVIDIKIWVERLESDLSKIKKGKKLK